MSRRESDGVKIPFSELRKRLSDLPRAPRDRARCDDGPSAGDHRLAWSDGAALTRAPQKLSQFLH